MPPREGEPSGHHGHADRRGLETTRPTPRNSLQSYISHLRKALDRLVNAPGGYVLEVAPADIDAGRFEALVQRARTHADPADVVATLDAALALAGSAFADLADERSLAVRSPGLEELRLSATEDQARRRAAQPAVTALVGELESLTSRHPLRETLWGQLMLALYRSGRQGDALAAYTRGPHRAARRAGHRPVAGASRAARSDAATGPRPAGGDAAEPRTAERVAGRVAADARARTGATGGWRRRAPPSVP